MRCEMECSNKAKVKITTSQNELDHKHLCYRHGYRYLKTLLRRLNEVKFGIYVQRAPERPI